MSNIDENSSHLSSYTQYLELVNKFLIFEINRNQFCNKFLRIYLKLNAKSKLFLADRQKILKTIEEHDPNIQSNSIEFTILSGKIFMM